ncbi:MAG TPA: 30S ribosomal protein S6 [Thermoanaerobaculia bacterium]|nr:30S ribosomal protein S6 [Thermoanaerobaculia bacterium]
MRTYEVLFILSPQVTEEESTTLITDFKGVAEKLGATLKNEEPWGRRRLAYPINKCNEGIYHLLVYETEAGLGDLDRRMKNSDRILRHMIVRTDLDLKRAAKLAAKNPKKERNRPATASFSPTTSSPSAVSEDAVPTAATESSNVAVTEATPHATADAPSAGPTE